MGVEFDFRINVTDCLAGFSLLNGLSLFVGCVVVPFLLLFFILLSAAPLPSPASFVCSWILADRRAELSGPVAVDGPDKCWLYSCLILFSFFPPPILTFSPSFVSLFPPNQSLLREKKLWQSKRDAL